MDENDLPPGEPPDQPDRRAEDVRRLTEMFKGLSGRVSSSSDDTATSSEEEDQRHLREQASALWQFTKEFTEREMSGLLRWCLKIVLFGTIVTALSWLVVAIFSRLGMTWLGAIAPAVVAVLASVTGVIGSRRLPQQVMYRPVEPTGDDWPSQAAETVATVVTKVAGTVMGLCLATTALGMCIVAAGIARNPDDVELSPSGMEAAIWHFIDTVPFLSVPKVWGLDEPSTAGTPVGFRVCLLAARAAAILGFVAAIQGARRSSSLTE